MMSELSDSYIREVAGQIAFMSALLGGFSITYLATLLSSNSPKRISNWIIIGSSIAACSFIVAVIGSVSLIILSHPDAPASVTLNHSISKERIISSLGFFIGIISLLISIGLSGWFRSKKLGIATSLISFCSLLLIFSFLSD